jgi:hypothetical protein
MAFASKRKIPPEPWSGTNGRDFFRSMCAISLGSGDSLEVSLGRWLGLLAVAALAAGCATQPPDTTSGPQARSSNRFIYVTTQDLPGECYRNLGVVKFDEPFTDATIDEDNSASAQRLRTLAMKNYPNDADAVIGVRKEQNDAGTMVTVTGQAVELQNHETVTCAIRKVPGVLDHSAALAAGGITGAALEGSLSGSVQGAETGAALGATGVAKYQLSDEQREAQAQEAEIKHHLDEQRSQINQLLAERSRLRECQQEELPLSDCKLDENPTDQNDSAKSSDTAWNGSLYELEKQIQEQQVYIGQLEDQISDLRREMAGY